MVCQWFITGSLWQAYSIDWAHFWELKNLQAFRGIFNRSSTTLNKCVVWFPGNMPDNTLYMIKPSILCFCDMPPEKPYKLEKACEPSRLPTPASAGFWLAENSWNWDSHRLITLQRTDRKSVTSMSIAWLTLWALAALFQYGAGKLT